MSGELTLSQFKSTTTQNNDFVIGNPIPIGNTTDISDRYLVFQVSDQVGPAHNPHIKAEKNLGGNWQIKLSDNGITDNDFAFLNSGTSLAPQLFVGVNTFQGVVNFTGNITTRSMTLGASGADTITFLGSPIFTGPLTFDSTITFTNDVTVNAPTKHVLITASTVKIANKTVTLNETLAITAGGIGILTGDATSGTTPGYIKTTSDNSAWIIKAPVRVGTITLQPSTTATDMLIRPVGGAFAYNKILEVLSPATGLGYIGTYQFTPVGGKVLVSTIDGFAESATLSSKLNFLNNVTSDIQTQLGANNSVIFTLTSRIDGVQSDITATNSAMSTLSSTTANSIVSLNSSMNNTVSYVNSTLTTYSNNISAISSSVSSLSTTVGGYSASISSNTASINGLEANYGIRIDNNGHISGIGLSSGVGGLSAFSVLANQFEFVDPGNGTVKLTPFYYTGGVLHLDGSVVFTGSAIFNPAPGDVLNALNADLGLPAPVGTTINGAHITTGTVTAANLLSYPTQTGGTNIAAPVGFRISSVPFNTTLIGGLVPVEVQAEFGANVNIGGYLVGAVTAKVFAAPSVAFYASLGATTQYPYAALNSPMPLYEQIRSGISVSQTTPGVFTAQIAGIYTFDISCLSHGSSISTSALTVYLGIKRAASPSSGYATLIFKDSTFFGTDKSEGHVSGTVVCEMLIGDSVGLFYTAPGMSYINIWFTIGGLGPKAASDVLLITTPGITVTSTGSFPQTVNFPLAATNGFGLYTWSIDAPGGDALALDGTTTPTATIASDGQSCNVYYATAPTYGVTKHIKLRVVDEKSAVSTQTINFIFNSTASIVITTPGASDTPNYTNIVVTTYPATCSAALTATGGSGVYTWTIVSAGTLSGSITGSTLSGSFTVAGSKYCTVRCTDSSSAFVEKVINIQATTYVSGGGGGGGGGCFVKGTLVLMADGTSKPIELVVPGDTVYAINTYAHQSGLSNVVVTEVTEIATIDIIQPIMLVKGVQATNRHPWGITEPESGARQWIGSEFLTEKMLHRTITCDSKNKLKVIDVPAEKPIAIGTTDKVYSLSTVDNSYFVSSTASSNWYLVHNMSIITLY